MKPLFFQIEMKYKHHEVTELRSTLTRRTILAASHTSPLCRKCGFSYKDLNFQYHQRCLDSETYRKHQRNVQLDALHWRRFSNACKRWSSSSVLSIYDGVGKICYVEKMSQNHNVENFIASITFSSDHVSAIDVAFD